MADPIFGMSDAPESDLPSSPLDYGVGAGQYLGATLEGALENNMGIGLVDAVRFKIEERTGENVDEKAATKELEAAGVKRSVMPWGMSRTELDYLKLLEQHRRQREEIFERNQSTFNYAASLPLYMGAQVADPVNVASAFVPVVSAAKYGAMIERAGVSGWARAAVRARVGAMEGAAGAALVEPLNAFLQISRGNPDYGLVDSLANIAFGAPFGAALHSIGGAVVDYGEPSRVRSIAPHAPDDVKRQAFAAALDAVANDGRVNAAKVFADHAGLDAKAAAEPLAFSEGELRDAREAVVIARGLREEVQPTQSLLSAIRSVGGIRVTDGQGNVTREGAEVLAVLRDYKSPGLINNKRGKTPDYVREALAEDGWFNATGEDVGEIDIQDFYDVLEKMARKEPVTRVGDYRGKTLKQEAEGELKAAGVVADDTMAVASSKIAAYRAAALRERATDLRGEPDFSPQELVGDVERGRPDDGFPGEGTPGREGFDDDAPDLPPALDDAKVAAYNAKPELARATEEAAALSETVREYAAQGLLAEEDLHVLTEAEMQTRWADLRARAYEAAAGCMSVFK